ncbi:MAG TPA: hypothetical protein VGG85_08935 [Terracidiphilus sp.]|jgi:hypothetical protein
MHSVKIPGDLEHTVITIDWGKDLFLDFGDSGEFVWEEGGARFNPHLPRGYVKKERLGRFVAPNHDDTVAWTFVSSEGSERSGLIKVRDLWERDRES